MKIKVKKTMSHGDFAKYMVERYGMDSLDLNFSDEDGDGMKYTLSIVMNDIELKDYIKEIKFNDDTITFKTEEDITVDTVIPKLLVVHKRENNIVAGLGTSISIKSYKKDLAEYDYAPLTFHYVHEDGTVTLLWKDGEMV